PAVRMIYPGGAYYIASFYFTLHQKSTEIVDCSSLGTVFQVRGRFKTFPPNAVIRYGTTILFQVVSAT
ncbi:MAG: hypothetical protein P8O73_00535, partial [SAR324 cluster bacterium]|nr:hypothetical protein [SAR324 cluster bacterium]